MPQVAKFGAGKQMVPGPVPPGVTGLTMVEQQMIVCAHPVCKGIRIRGGKYAHEGHVANISQDVTTLATDRPWLLTSDELPIIIQPSNGGAWEGRKFLVNPAKVEPALVRLIHIAQLVSTSGSTAAIVLTCEAARVTSTTRSTSRPTSSISTMTPTTVMMNRSTKGMQEASRELLKEITGVWARRANLSMAWNGR